MALAALWKPIPSHLKARSEKSAPKQSQPIPAHPNQYALIAIEPSITFAEDEPIRPPDLVAAVNETRPTPYKRIQHRREQSKAKKMQRKEDNRFLDGAIIAAEDERTAIAKADDNPCLFKASSDANNTMHPRKEPSDSFSIVQSAKNICYSVSRAYRRATRMVRDGFDSHSVHFRDDVMLATYNDRKASGPLKLLHVPAPIYRTRRDPKSFLHMRRVDAAAPEQPITVDEYGLSTPLPIALKEPMLIPLPSKEMRRLKRRTEKYNGLSSAEQKQIKRLKRREQRNLKTVRPPDEAKAAIKAGQRTKPTEPRRQRKLRSTLAPTATTQRSSYGRQPDSR